MADEEKTKSWWQTLPGLITSLTAAVTAVAGLVVALKQVGWIGETPAQPPTQAQTQTQAQPQARQGTDAAKGPDVYSVTLPALRDYRLGDYTYTLLAATLSPQTTEKDALRIQVRMTNNQGFDANFWDQSFRLVVDGIPGAPTSNLNELVQARTAKEGTVLFEVPHGAASVSLQINYLGEQTAVALALPPRR